jgi:predicted CxxxxCH...CXXCH cytochrome family protein
MSQITVTVRLVTSICAVLLVVVGCGTPNEKSAFDPDMQKHAADWIYAGHAGAAQAQVTSCTECHGEDLLGGVSMVSCSECHPKGPSPMTGCTSCHGNPPNGNAAPNRAGVHALHFSFINGAGGECGSCHNKAGSKTANHYNGTVEVHFTSNFDAKSGAVIRNPDGTCSNVSCHGGQTTPGWASGTSIDVGTQCTSCHIYGTTQYNSFFSGKHDKHINDLHFPCNRCHDTAKLALSHFQNLNTQSMEGPASETIYSFLRYTFDVYGNRLCGAACHPSRIWN